METNHTKTRQWSNIRNGTEITKFKEEEDENKERGGEAIITRITNNNAASRTDKARIVFAGNNVHLTDDVPAWELFQEVCQANMLAS
eukprot:16195977-Heterocapsa_arctica.AAC.1